MEIILLQYNLLTTRLLVTLYIFQIATFLYSLQIQQRNRPADSFFTFNKHTADNPYNTDFGFWLSKSAVISFIFVLLRFIFYFLK